MRERLDKQLAQWELQNRRKIEQEPREEEDSDSSEDEAAPPGTFIEQARDVTRNTFKALLNISPSERRAAFEVLKEVWKPHRRSEVSANKTCILMYKLFKNNLIDRDTSTNLSIVEEGLRHTGIDVEQMVGQMGEKGYQKIFA